jgi:uncharacterized repeat protein (TIGR01451 family)
MVELNMSSNLIIKIVQRGYCYPLFIILFMYYSTASATLFSINTRLTGSNSVAGDQTGFSVALSADNKTMIFGSPAASVDGISSAGAVYVFVYSNGIWVQQAELTEATPHAGDFFGNSVALSADGNVAVIGAQFSTVSGMNAAGAAFVFKRVNNTWSEQATFNDPTPASADLFGSSVAISGDATTLLVGAPGVTVNGQSQAGAVFSYIQSNNAWSAPTSFSASDASTHAGFGTVSLSTDGSTSIIGAGTATVNGIQGAGKAYFFNRSNGTWIQVQEFIDPGTGVDGFASAVALSGDGETAVVGAYNTTLTPPGSPFGLGAGEAYVYSRDNGGWSLQQAIENPANSDPSPGALEGNFGHAVTLTPDGNTALITADQATANPSFGQAFVFSRTRSTWTKTQEIDDPGQTSGDRFGISTALSSNGTAAFIGSFGSSGAHYVYVINSPDDLSLAVSADGTAVSPGQSLTYMLTVTNKDVQVTATNVTVIDTLPNGVTAKNSTTGCTGTAGVVTCVDAALTPGATYQPSITITAPANATGEPFNIVDVVTVSADQPDPNVANNNVDLATIVKASSMSVGGGKGGSGDFGILPLILLAALFSFRVGTGPIRNRWVLPEG